MIEPRVLIVEGNDALRAMLFTILRHQPVGVDTAVTADDAWQKILNCDYALIVMDMDTPEAAGFLTRFREERPEAVVRSSPCAIRARKSRSIGPRRCRAEQAAGDRHACGARARVRVRDVPPRRSVAVSSGGERRSIALRAGTVHHELNDEHGTRNDEQKQLFRVHRSSFIVPIDCRA
jgi:hypothetical protein